MMKRLLTTEEKRSYKEVYRDNPVMKAIKAAYKEKETEMQNLSFSPEEIWLNCFIEFDRMLQEKDRLPDITKDLWRDIYTDLRDEAKDNDREYEETELQTATSCIVCAIICCIEATEDYEMICHSERLMTQISRYHNTPEILYPLHWALEDDFVYYIKDYVVAGNYISGKNRTTQKESEHPIQTNNEENYTEKKKKPTIEKILAGAIVSVQKQSIKDSKGNDVPLLKTKSHWIAIYAVFVALDVLKENDKKGFETWCRRQKIDIDNTILNSIKGDNVSDFDKSYLKWAQNSNSTGGKFERYNNVAKAFIKEIDDLCTLHHICHPLVRQLYEKAFNE